MPPTSKAQNRLMQAAAHTKGGVAGVPRRTAQTWQCQKAAGTQG